MKRIMVPVDYQRGNVLSYKSWILPHSDFWILVQWSTIQLLFMASLLPDDSTYQIRVSYCENTWKFRVSIYNFYLLVLWWLFLKLHHETEIVWNVRKWQYVTSVVMQILWCCITFLKKIINLQKFVLAYIKQDASNLNYFSTSRKLLKGAHEWYPNYRNPNHDFREIIHVHVFFHGDHRKWSEIYIAEFPTNPSLHSTGVLVLVGF